MSDPFAQFATWFAEAQASEANDYNAMTLATANQEGHPSARIVLLKDWDSAGFVFYTNQESRKADDLRENARMSAMTTAIAVAADTKFCTVSAAIWTR